MDINHKLYEIIVLGKKMLVIGKPHDNKINFGYHKVFYKNNITGIVEEISTFDNFIARMDEYPLKDNNTYSVIDGNAVNFNETFKNDENYGPKNNTIKIKHLDLTVKVIKNNYRLFDNYYIDYNGRVQYFNTGKVNLLWFLEDGLRQEKIGVVS